MEGPTWSSVLARDQHFWIFFLFFFFFGLRSQRLFVWRETSGKVLFIRTILVKAGPDSNMVSRLVRIRFTGITEKLKYKVPGAFPLARNVLSLDSIYLRLNSPLKLTSNRYQAITSVRRDLNGKSLTGMERNSGNCYLRNTTLVRKIVVICRLSFLQQACVSVWTRLSSHGSI